MNIATLVPSTETAPATSVVTRTAPIIHNGEPTIRSIHRPSITAGAGLLLMSALSAIGYLVAVKGARDIGEEFSRGSSLDVSSRPR